MAPNGITRKGDPGLEGGKRIVVIPGMTAQIGISAFEIVWRILLLVLFLALSAFFSASEIALVSINRFRIMSLKEEGHRKAGSLEKLLDQPNRFLSTILVFTLMIQVGAAAVATSLALALKLPVATALATGVMTFLIFIFSEMAPKTYASNNPEKEAFFVAPYINLLARIFYPAVRLLIYISNGVIRLFGGKVYKEGPFVTEGDIKALVSAAEEQDVIEEEEKKLIHSIFEFGDTLVREVMIQIGRAHV